MNPLESTLTLPCGVSLKNRVAKSALTEGLATALGLPTPELERLYGLWSDGGAGLLISGNIQIDADHLERPGNVVIPGEASAELRTALESWARVATSNGNHFWAQISHAGRQTQKIVNPTPKAPSAIKLDLPGGQFGSPIALTVAEIQSLVERFANTAAICQSCGFTGVQIHAAHGYLLSSFLNPRANVRGDQYGGSLENRARFLLDVIAATRAKVGDEFPIAVKLNSADFQKGGFSFTECLQVAKWLAAAGIDLLEISGGNYEQPKLLGVEGLEESEDQNIAPSTAAREAYFVDFAKAIQAEITTPIMVTGGLRTRAAMDVTLSSNAAQLIGLGRPFCTMTDAPTQLFNGLQTLPTVENELRLFPNWLSFLRRFQMLKTMDNFAVQFWFYGQLYALGRTGQTDLSLSPFRAVLDVETMNRKLVKEAKKNLAPD